MDDMIGECSAIREVYARIDKVSDAHDGLIMVNLEMGKELVLRPLQRSMGRPADDLLNCAAIWTA